MPATTMMTTAADMPLDMEEFYNSMKAEMFADLERLGTTWDYIGEVALGPAGRDARTPATRIVKVPPTAAVAWEEGFVPAGPEMWAARQRRETDPVEESLLGMIHRHHIDALAAMSKGDVVRHARGMVFAGYVYGPLPDPVSNIVANALWYDSAFPPRSPSPRVRMLSAKAIFRMARRSLDAFIAFMGSYAPTLSTKEALLCLLDADGNLQEVVEMLGQTRVGDEVAAFRAAILAVHLPNEAAREAHLSFVTSYDDAQGVLADHGFRSIPIHQPRYRIHQPDLLLEPYVSPQADLLLEPYVPRRSRRRRRSAATSTSSQSALSPSAHRALRLKMHSFKVEEELSLALAQRALQKLALQLGEPYQLHMMCGQTWILSTELFYHINFLASPEGGSNLPTLFFAEVRGINKDVNDVTLCCPLTEKNGRCFLCDCKGVKLIHPDNKEFHGVENRDEDNYLMQDPTMEFGVPLNEDYMFFEFDQHPEIATYLEANYSSMNADQVDLSFLWFENYLP